MGVSQWLVGGTYHERLASDDVDGYAFLKKEDMRILGSDPEPILQWKIETGSLHTKTSWGQTGWCNKHTKEEARLGGQCAQL